MSYFNAKNLTALSNDVLRRKAPAIFAEAPKNTTSDNYLFIPTGRLIDGLRGQGWEVVSAKQSMNRASSFENRDTNKHALFLARRDSLTSFRGPNVGDSLPLLKMTNSHNGMSSFGLSTGFFRFVCANGLTVSEAIYAAPKVRHVKDMADEVINATYKVLNDFPMLVEMRNSLQGITLNREEQMLLGDAAADIFFDREDRERLNRLAKAFRDDKYLLESQIVSAQRYEDRKVDLWTMSNVIQENMIRGNVRLATDSTNKYNGGHEYALRSQRKVTSIDRDNDIHDKLFKLTQKFAELKGVRIGTAA